MQIAEQKHTASTEAFHLGIGAKSKRNLEIVRAVQGESIRARKTDPELTMGCQRISQDEEWNSRRSTDGPNIVVES
ncbi:hypothetical protein IFM47457_01499 [Aspergillus lentulus]|nr:hypothetical protein IFM47457_01499 [Aspergillus lentulus]